MKHRRSFIVIFFWLCLFAACSPLNEAGHDACKTDEDCMDGKVCSSLGKCIDSAADSATGNETATDSGTSVFSDTISGDTIVNSDSETGSGTAVSTDTATEDTTPDSDSETGSGTAVSTDTATEDTIPDSDSETGSSTGVSTDSVTEDTMPDSDSETGSGTEASTDTATEDTNPDSDTGTDTDSDSTTEEEPWLAPDARYGHVGYDQQHTSYNPNEVVINDGNVSTLEFKWGIGCNDGYFNVMFQSPAIADSLLFVSSAGDRLNSYNALTGTPVGTFTDSPGGASVWKSQPFVDADGILYYLEDSNPSTLFAVDSDFNRLWTAPIQFELGYNAEVVLAVDEVKDLVYLVETPFAESGKLFALNRQTGEVAWYLGPQINNYGFQGNYALILDGEVYARAEDETQQIDVATQIVVVDPESKSVVDSFMRPATVDTNQREISNITICNRRLVATYCDRADVFESEGTLVTWDIDSGDVLWTQPYSSKIGKVACDPQSDTLFVPIDPYLYALDATTGDEDWKHTALGKVLAPSIANGVVYFLSTTNMYALSQETGDQKFSYPLGETADDTTGVAVCGGMVFFSGNGGTCDLFALGLP